MPEFSYNSLEFPPSPFAFTSIKTVTIPDQPSTDSRLALINEQEVQDQLRLMDLIESLRRPDTDRHMIFRELKHLSMCKQEAPRFSHNFKLHDRQCESVAMSTNTELWKFRAKEESKSESFSG